MAVLANSTLKLLLFWLIWVQPGFLRELDETQLQERTSRFVWVSRNGLLGQCSVLRTLLAGGMNEIIRLQSIWMVLGIHAAGLARVVFAMQIRLQAGRPDAFSGVTLAACFVPEHDPLGPGRNQLPQLQVPLGSS
jgi:hypothetical protein